MSGILAGRRVLLVVGGGIAAYKAPIVVRALIAEGAEVRCIMTDAASHFVTELSLQTVSLHPVGRNLLDPAEEAGIGHIELARWPDLILIAPATANLIARMANGMATDLASTVLLATTAPVVVVPAMNTAMYLHPATQENLAKLRSWGHTVVAPDEGELACLEVGPGRQPDPPDLVEAVGRRITDSPLAGKRILVSAGPTRAHLDPVRFITNPSTGRMGVALARAAEWLGASATLVAGPGVTLPEGLSLSEVVSIETVDELAEAVLGRQHSVDWLIMAAAVGDYAPGESLGQKRKKGESSETWTLTLERTLDVLAESCRRRRDDEALGATKIVGFAAETDNLEEYAQRKLASKGCDLILGNWVRSAHGDTFGSDSVELHGFGSDGWNQRFGPGTKFKVAMTVLRMLAAKWSNH